MSGRIDPGRTQAMGRVPGMPELIEDLLADFPEMAEEFGRLVHWRDVGQPERLSRDFERMYPSRRPRPYSGT